MHWELYNAGLEERKEAYRIKVTLISARYTLAISSHTYIAYVSDYPTCNNPLGFIVTVSNTVSVFWW